MGVRRFVQQPDGELLEVTDRELARPRAVGGDTVLWNDRAYQDMGDPRFSSRSQHKDYMKAAGVTTIDDYKGQWAAAEKARIDFRQGRGPSVRREVEQSIAKLQQGYKPRLMREE